MGKKLEIMNLSYRDFNSINLSFNDKTYYSIIGSNNCGKTTLFKLISGIIPTNNTIYYNNVCLNNYNSYDCIINFGVVDRLNKNSFMYGLVLEEMIYPLHNLGYSKKKSIERIKEVLSLFQAIDYMEKNISTLNYYEKQLLLIMIAILHKPKVLLLDSVLEVFPFNMKKKIVCILRKLSNEEMIVINFTNCLEEAYESDKFILMDKYQIIGEYDKHDIYQNDKLFYEHNLEIPFLVDLNVKLKMYNLIDKEYMSMKEMVDDIWP